MIILTKLLEYITFNLREESGQQLRILMVVVKKQLVMRQILTKMPHMLIKEKFHVYERILGRLFYITIDGCDYNPAK